MHVDGWTTAARRVVLVASEVEARVLATSLAYYMFNSFVPALLLVFIALSLEGDLRLLSAAVELATGVDAGRLERLFDSVTNGSTTRRPVIVLAVLILTWSTFRLFVAIDRAFALVYGNSDARSIDRVIHQIGLALATIAVAVGVLVGVGLTLAVVLSNHQSLVMSVLTFLVLFIAFLPMFYFFPRADVALVDALPGTVLTTLFWGVTGSVVRLYAEQSPSVDFFGAIGGLLVVLTWLYLASLVLVVGIVVNGVRSGAPGAEPS